MDYKTYIILFVAGFLAVNFFTQGYAVNQALSLFDSESGQSVRTELQCLAGIFIIRPIKHFDAFGLDFYFPFIDTDDIILAAFGTIIIAGMFKMVGKELDTKWWYVFFFFMIIFLYKLLGALLIFTSTEGCLGMAIVSSQILAPFDWILLAIGVPIIAVSIIQMLSHKN